MTATAQLDSTDARIALTVSGKVYGPYSLRQIETYVAEGRVTATSLVSSNGGSWVPAAEDPVCSALFAHIEAAMEADAPVDEPAAVTAEAAAPAAVAAPQVAAVTEDPDHVPTAREAFLKELEGVTRLRNPAFAAEAPGDRRHGVQDRRTSDRSIVAKAEAEAAEKAESEYGNFVLVFDMKSRHHGRLEEAIMDLGKATRVFPGTWVLHARHTSASIRNQLLAHFGKLDSLFIIDATRDKLAWFNLGPEADSLIRGVWKKS